MVLRISVGLPDLYCSISIPHYNEHVPEAPMDLVLCVCVFLYTVCYLHVDTPVLKHLPGQEGSLWNRYTVADLGVL